jgi:hypothetical protein
MAPTVVYVHGNGNKPAADTLKRIWDQALFGEPAGNRSRMAYWADLRYPAPLPDHESDELAMAPGGEEGVAEEELHPEELVVEAVMQAHAETLLEAPVTAGGAAAEESAPGAALDSWVQDMAYTADALVQGESATSAGELHEEALPLPKAARVAIFRALVKRTFADVYAYFFGGSGDAMRERMREALDAVSGPVVVVSHSLGTIIAYDVLRERARNVPLLITAGSPLAVQEIQDLVTAPLLVPNGVTVWRNVADARDLVALDKTIRPEYAPADRVRDFLVVNDSDNHHDIRTYLRTAPVHDAVAALFR